MPTFNPIYVFLRRKAENVGPRVALALLGASAALALLTPEVRSEAVTCRETHRPHPSILPWKAGKILHYIQSFILAVLAFSAFTAGSAISPTFAQSADEAAIIGLMRKTWDQPSAPVTVAPIVIHDAVVGWAQDQRGGRALLRRKHGVWIIVLCSGDSLKHAHVLVWTGIPEANAKQLAAQIAKADSALPKATVALFDSFEGTVMVDEKTAIHRHGVAHGK